MALGWGDNTWGEYGWGGAIPVSGNQADAAVGTATSIVSVAISGISASGAVDSVIPSKSVAELGDIAIATVGLVGTSVTVALTGVSAKGLVGFGWGDDTWGSNVWGGYSVGTGKGYGNTGVIATGSVGNVGLGARTIALTGISASGAVGSVVQSANKALTGATATGDVGTVGRTNTVGVTGNIAYGLVNQIIVPLNSNEAVGSVGTVSVGEISVALTGVSSSGQVNTMGVPRSLSLTGNSARGNVGTPTAVYWKIIDDNQPTTWQNINTS
jgi:hypothetical protein